MATYRFEAKIIGRSAGSSATASAAYRSAERLEDERTGAVFDYTRKRGVLHSEIIAPAGTPEWMLDRAQLWNAVEKAEKRKDSQLARDLLLSLPHELTHDQRVALLREFVSAEFVAEGMIADLAVHAPDREADTRNHHAHIMLTMRELAGEGFGPKVRAWNDTDLLEEWREHWANAVNRHLERYGHEARVDHRSNADQGLDREPEPKQGPVATEMERAGHSSHAGADRRAAQERNKLRATLADELAAVSAEIIDLQEERAKRAGQETMSGTVTVEEATASLFETIERRNQAQQAKQPTAAEAEQRRAEALARENLRKQQDQAEEMEALKARLQTFEKEQARRAEEARQEEERKKEAAARGNAAEGGIGDAGDRYRIALAEHYDITSPYASLARAAMAEYGSFLREREQFNRQIAEAKDGESRRLLELQRDIQFADYISIGSERIAFQSTIISGRRDTEEEVKFRERAKEYQTQSQTLRREFRELITSGEERELLGRAEIRPTGQGSEVEKPVDRGREQNRRQHEAAKSPSESRAERPPRSSMDSLRGEERDALEQRIKQGAEEIKQSFAREGGKATGRDRGGGGQSR
jgi:hypothetical protein